MPFSKCGSLIPTIGDDPVVASAWERFLRDQSIPETGVRPVIVDSWQRCHSDSVDPASRCAPGASEEKVSSLLWQNRELCDTARRVMDGLRDILRECDTLIMLSDETGTVLQLSGETRVRSAGEAINLAPGGYWNEEVIGTNAIGTAIATKAPVQVYANEHFCMDVKRWTCAAAPIFDPVSRMLLGVVDVSGCRRAFKSTQRYALNFTQGL